MNEAALGTDRARKTKFRPRAILSLLFALAGAWAVFESRDWPLSTRLFPWLVGIPVLGLAFIQSLFELLGWAREDEGVTDLQSSISMNDEISRKRTAYIVSGIGAYAVCIWLLGFEVALVLMLLVFLRVIGRESWKISVSLTVAGYVLFRGIFRHLLNIHLPTGAVWPMIEELSAAFR